MATKKDEKTYTQSSRIDSLNQDWLKQKAKQPAAYNGSDARNKANQILAATKSYRNYKDSDSTLSLKGKLNKMMNGYGEQWTGGKYGTAMENALNDYANQKAFSYDLNGDLLYNQYKDQYMRQGQQAMADTMGQAAQLNGGYGSSYSQLAGQQAYNQQIDALNDRIPELYNLALQTYQTNADRLRNRYAAYADAYNTDYGEYRDRAADFYNNRDFLSNEVSRRENWERQLWQDGLDRLYDMYGLYDGADKTIYDRNQDALNNYMNLTNMKYDFMNGERNFEAGQYADAYARNYQAGRDAVADNQWAQNLALSQQKAASSGGSSSTNSSSGNNSKYKKLSSADQKKLENYAANGQGDSVRTLLENASLSPSDYDKYMKQYGGTTSASNPSSGKSASTNFSASNALNEAVKAGGGDPNKTILALEAMLEAGNITQKQFDDLKFAVLNPGK